MRHGKKINHLGRKAAHRKAMLANMACSLIEHKRIKTTLAKAKALRVYVEPIITKAKTDSIHSRRVVFSYLKNKEAIKELFGPVAVSVAERPGGYTRILKIGNRLGDNAEMAIIELVDFSEFAPDKLSTKETSKKKRRRRSSSKKKSSEAQADTPVVEDEVTVAEVSPELETVETPEETAAETEVQEEEAATVEAEEEVEATEEEETPAADPEAQAEAPATEVEADDLKKVEGIGPKIASILHEAGILTFAQLAATDADKIREILTEAGSRYKSHDPTTWPEQAQLAADGAWDELKALQDKLQGGKEVE